VSDFNAIRDKLSSAKMDLSRDFGVSEIGLFGSVVRGTAALDSDIDILVDFDQAIELFTFVRLKDRLAELTGTGVDLVMKKGLKPRISQRILQEVEYV